MAHKIKYRGELGLTDLYIGLLKKGYFESNIYLYVPIPNNRQNNAKYKTVLKLFENFVCCSSDAKIFNKAYLKLRELISLNRQEYGVYLLEIMKNTFEQSFTNDTSDCTGDLGMVLVACFACLVDDRDNLIIGNISYSNEVIVALRKIFSPSTKDKTTPFEDIIQPWVDKLGYNFPFNPAWNIIKNDVTLDRIYLLQGLYNYCITYIFDPALIRSESMNESITELFYSIIEQGYHSTVETLKCLMDRMNFDKSVISTAKVSDNTSGMASYSEELLSGVFITPNYYSFSRCLDLKESNRISDFDFGTLVSRDDELNFTEINRKGYIPPEEAKTDIMSLINRYGLNKFLKFKTELFSTISYQEVIYPDGLVLIVTSSSKKGINIIYKIDYRTDILYVLTTFIDTVMEGETPNTDESIDTYTDTVTTLTYLHYKNIVESEQAVPEALLSDEYIKYCEKQRSESNTANKDSYTYKAIYIAPYKRKHSDNFNPSPETVLLAKRFGILLGPHETLVTGFIRNQRYKKETLENTEKESVSLKSNVIQSITFGS